MLFEVIPNFLTPDQCSLIINRARPKLKPSRSNKKFITSTWLDRSDPGIRSICERVSEYTKISLSQQETLHVLNYQSGDKNAMFHYDAFAGDIDHVRHIHGGQRTHSFLVYLSDGCIGGGTYFPKYQNTKIEPEIGKAVYWSNTIGDKIDPLSYHAALPVEQGEKWSCAFFHRDVPAPIGQIWQRTVYNN